jgi:superfamily II DNA or RNA helicase
VNSKFQLRFDKGTVCVDVGDTDVPVRASDLPGVLWDERTLGFRAPARAARAIVDRVGGLRGEIARPLPWPERKLDVARWAVPPLRDYQRTAFRAWNSFAHRGVVVLPTGAGKTRVAVAAMSAVCVPTAVFCPTRVLVEQWSRELAHWYSGPIGIVGDGENRIEDVTILTFESAYRRMDTLGDKFALIVIDEVHNMGGGARTEALEMATAPMRLGLTATALPSESAGAARLDVLVGPVVCEVGLADLVGEHLADFSVIRISVVLSEHEARDYEAAYAAFGELRRAFARAHPKGDWVDLQRALSASAAGRAALRGFQRATAIASLPDAKKRQIAELLAEHRGDKVLVFAATADDAYSLAHENLIPVITAETSRGERERILAMFRDGSVRAIVSARVLNEGVDVPDARVAVLAGTSQGVREVVQRVGRVLRPAPGKRAVVYELTTRGTMDDRRAEARRRLLVPRCAAFA